MNWKILFIIILLLIFAGLLFTKQGQDIIARFRERHFQLTIHLKDPQQNDVTSTEVGVFRRSEGIEKTIEIKETNENGIAKFSLPAGKYSIWVSNPLRPDSQEIIYFPGASDETSLFSNKTVEVNVNR